MPPNTESSNLGVHNFAPGCVPNRSPHQKQQVAPKQVDLLIISLPLEKKPQRFSPQNVAKTAPMKCSRWPFLMPIGWKSLLIELSLRKSSHSKNVPRLWRIIPSVTKNSRHGGGSRWAVPPKSCSKLLSLKGLRYIRLKRMDL
ncbi:hypothetical protein TNCT_354471 [Trichonephila clavata]|uniref:Uncharacterized protein n=1 Tax=Trichonephila clavata TaxID=2740835 RepID=A0A8X6FT80_TRICU|nr:hypothetical protein TNCT_354471 [Trichonephila clavata]